MCFNIVFHSDINILISSYIQYVLFCWILLYGLESSSEWTAESSSTGSSRSRACIGDVYLITLYIYIYRYNTILNHWMIVVSGYESWRPSDSVKNSICRGEWSLVVKIV